MSTRCHQVTAKSGRMTAAVCWSGIARTRSSGEIPCTYQSAANPATIGSTPCTTLGRVRRPGRLKPAPATSPPRKRMSSSVSIEAVARSRSQVPAAADRSVTASGPRTAGTACGPASPAAKTPRDTSTCPEKGTAASRLSLRMPGSSAVPASALTSRITGVSVFCASLPLFEAVVTARHVAADRAASPANASTVTRIATTALSGSAMVMSAGRNRRDTAAVAAIETALAASVASVTVNTARNLPKTMSREPQGAIRSVSIVPRSFSPAMASIAG